MSGPAQSTADPTRGLRRRGIAALVLEAAPSLGHAWRNHYDRLHLHTVKGRSHLPGLRCPRTVPLVVGAGNTGAALALDLVEHGAAPTLSVRGA